MGLFRRCIDCGEYTSNGSRCRSCAKAKRDRMYDNAEWRRIRAEAVAASPVCARCSATEDLTADHVRAGSTAAGVVTLCRSCNSAKGDR